MNRIFLLLLFLFISCSHEDNRSPEPKPETKNFISAVDISRYPEISKANLVFYDTDGTQKDFLSILKDNGINTIRLRLWVNPTDQHCGFDEVKQFSQTLKAKGFKIWLSLHYSDSWADPANQETPAQWQNLDFNALKENVHLYTKKVVTEIQPDYIQIGNEINNGILFPYGNITTNFQNFKALIQAGCAAVRENSNSCKIILHYAGIENSEWFFNQISQIDYDIIGLSYYPIWHGKSLALLKTTLQNLSSTHQKQILIAETAYPFTLDWNDWTQNIVGTDTQLILPEYPATQEGQQKFVRDLKQLVNEVDKGIGLCYWGAELIAWKGNQSTTGSTWENQALFDFSNRAISAIKELKK